MENVNGLEGNDDDPHSARGTRPTPRMSRFNEPPPRVTARRLGRSRQPLSARAAAIRLFSERLVEAQRPLRTLDLLRWDDHVETLFFADDARELPRVTAETYHARRLPFDPESQVSTLERLESDVYDTLGSHDPAAVLLMRRCREYTQVIELLQHRGTPRFSELSARLFGASSDPCPPDGRSLLEHSHRLATLLDAQPDAPEEASLTAADVVSALSDRLSRYFRNTRSVRVRLSAELSADAAAGGDCIKVRWDARFRPRDLRMLEVHEGWVHLGTTLNGQAQSICTFLAKTAPSVTITQEGLAVLTELLALASDATRVRRLAQRVQAVAMAEAGADFLDVYRFYLDRGHSPNDSYQHSARVFRGSLPARCGPFTKDLSYARGLLRLLAHLHTLTASGRGRHIGLLFCGKVALEDLDCLESLVQQGLVTPPRHLPPPFVELTGMGPRRGETPLRVQAVRHS
jgi:uncharacterized protein (TIGR02421 family)